MAGRTASSDLAARTGALNTEACCIRGGGFASLLLKCGKLPQAPIACCKKLQVTRQQLYGFVRAFLSTAMRLFVAATSEAGKITFGLELCAPAKTAHSIPISVLRMLQGVNHQNATTAFYIDSALAVMTTNPNIYRHNDSASRTTMRCALP